MSLEQESQIRLRLRRVLALPIDYIANSEFERLVHDPLASDRQLANPCGDLTPDRDEPVCAADEVADTEVSPAGVPAYLVPLYGSKLLAPAEERELFRRLNFWKYLAAQLRGRLDPEQADEGLLARVERLLAAATTVRNHLVRSNLRLVVSIAKRFVDLDNVLPDLVSDGNLSLIMAIEKFDYARGYRFSTYATWAIRYNFARGVAVRRRRRSKQLLAEEGVLEQAEDSRTDARVALERQSRLEAVMGGLLERLDPREREILAARFGMHPTEGPNTLQEIARRLGVCKERVRQLEMRALNKLRAYAAEGRLAQFAE
ncbi:MAG: sigma-70 family RNA polymerase sigma factor [Pirellulales bacterium]|nr:sigma-70 family RNA polymerase sigma factor [Pirellulales bacterium]